MKGERYFSNLHVRDKVFWAKPKIAQVESNAKFILSLAEMQPIFGKDRSYFHTPLRTFRTTPNPSAAPFLRGRPKKRTKNETGATTDDKLLTLSTCTGTGHATRWVVQGKLVNTYPQEAE